MKKTSVIIYLLVLLFSFFIFPNSTALADCEESGLLPPCTCSGRCGLNDFLSLGSRLVQYGIGILAAVALGFIIYSGFSLLMSFGNPEKVEAGKKRLGGTIRGVVMVLLAWALVNTIIFILTGNNSGFIFGEGPGWWEFEETKEIKEVLNMGGSFGEGKPEGCTNNTCTVYYLRDRDPQLNEKGEVCYYRRETLTKQYKVHVQRCEERDEKEPQLRRTVDYCISLGNCKGNNNFLCCDSGEIFTIQRE